MRMQGKHVGNAMRVLLSLTALFLTKTEPVRMRTSICGRGQQAFQYRYIYLPSREERKVRHYSVLSSLMEV